ncbi:MAG: PadR family transcriptional regulator [Acidimicrobiales bacterium]
MARVFGHGGLRLVLLSLLEDGPRHGYELIVALEERFLGMYRPSSGTVYPRLAALEDEGLIASEESDGKRVYRLTDAGREELRRRRSEVEDTFLNATTTVRSVMDNLQADVRAAVSAVQTELRQTRDQVRADTEWRDAREAVRQASRVAADEARRVRRMADDLRRHASHAATRDAAARGRHDLDDLAVEVASWAAEAVDHVRRYLPDEAQRARLRGALDEVRRAFIDTLDR